MLCVLPEQSDSGRKMSMGEEVVFKSEIIPANEAAEPEERRMSDLSDLAPSVASSVETQVIAHIYIIY